MEYPKNLPTELRNSWPRSQLLYTMVRDPMNLKNYDVEKGDPVLLIGTDKEYDAVLCEFLEYSSVSDLSNGKTYFKTPFKMVLRKPLIVQGKVELDIEIQNPENCNEYSVLMPTSATTLVVGMDMIEETLGRIGDYEVYSNIIAQEFDKLRTK